MHIAAIHHELDLQQRRVVRVVGVVGIGAQRCANAIRRLRAPPLPRPARHVTQLGRGVREHNILTIAMDDARVRTRLALHVLYPRPEPRTAALLGRQTDVVGGQAREGKEES